MIYHFHNGSYGIPFRAHAAAYSLTHGIAIVSVTSSKRTGKSNGIVHLLRRARTALANSSAGSAPRVADAMEELVVSDVNARAFLDRIQPGDFGIITGFNQIFSRAAIARFKTLVNFHASVLPYYRGPTPAHWCIRNHEKMTGFTVHDVAEKVDAGRILYQETVAVDGISEPRRLMMRIAKAAAPAFVRYLDHLRTGAAFEKRLMDADAVYTKKVDYLTFAPKS